MVILDIILRIVLNISSPAPVSLLGLLLSAVIVRGAILVRIAIGSHMPLLFLTWVEVDQVLFPSQMVGPRSMPQVEDGNLEELRSMALQAKWHLKIRDQLVFLPTLSHLATREVLRKTSKLWSMGGYTRVRTIPTGRTARPGLQF